MEGQEGRKGKEKAGEKEGGRGREGVSPFRMKKILATAQLQVVKH